MYHRLNLFMSYSRYVSWHLEHDSALFSLQPCGFSRDFIHAAHVVTIAGRIRRGTQSANRVPVFSPSCGVINRHQDVRGVKGCTPSVLVMKRWRIIAVPEKIKLNHSGFGGLHVPGFQNLGSWRKNNCFIVSFLTCDITVLLNHKNVFFLFQ